MEANSTTVASAAQQVSGTSVAWALTSIVMNAMLQPSFSGFYMASDSFAGAFWPSRSSPVLCLIDAAADAYIIMNKVLRPPKQRRKGKLASPADVLTRLATFVLAVLPQAVKLFGMRGIPRTQALAAIFLLSTLLSMARSIASREPLDDIVDLTAVLLEQPKLPTEVLMGIMGIGCFSVHCALTVLMWTLTGPFLHFDVTERTLDILLLVRLVSNLILILLMVLFGVLKLMGRKSVFSHWGSFVFIIAMQWIIPDTKKMESKGKKVMAWKSLSDIVATWAILLTSVIASLAIQFIIRILLVWTQKRTNADEEDANPQKGAPTSGAETATSAEGPVQEAGSATQSISTVSASPEKSTAKAAPSAPPERDWVAVFIWHTLLLALAISGFVTAGIYYLLFFDGKGTVAPAWVNFLA